MRARVSGGVAVAVMVPLLLAGCGGKEKPGAAKAKYIVESDAICTDLFAKASAAGTNHDQATAQKQSEVWLDGANRLKALPVPTESGELAKQFTTDVENMSLSFTAVANALQFNDQARVDKTTKEIDDIRKRAAATAKEYGYKECTRING